MLQFTQKDKDPRDHILHRNRTPRKGLSNQQIYQRKQNSRILRRSSIQEDEIKQEHFDWIDNIQKKLKLSDEVFAKRVGVSVQTRKLWKRRVGVFPSNISFRRLKKLERETKIEILDIKFIVRTRIAA